METATAVQTEIAKIWSRQQEDIFDVVVNDDGHLVIIARAGTGKTTTLLEAAARSNAGRIMICAFNKRIKQELELKNTNPRVTVKTLHGIGMAIVSRFWERIRICERGERERALTEHVCGGRVPDAIKGLISKLHTKGREIAPMARELGDLTELAIDFDCEPDPGWARDGFDLEFVERKALDAMERAAAVKPVDTGIDFADQIFLPVRNRWTSPQYDMVFVDEAQDMTVSQLEIARGICRGRLVLVGDDCQAIYGFRGADSQSLARLQAELQAVTRNLTTTYRCGRAIVAEAARLVPDFQAGPNNPEGEVIRVGYDRLLADAGPGDFVLSRKNAPLASVAMSFVRQQKRVKIAGKDIGAGLRAIVRKLAKGQAAKSIPALLEKIETWKEREQTRAASSNRPERADLIADQAETLTVLTDGVAGVAELMTRIDVLFTDDGLGAAGVITCSSVHKAKGLEADRVYVLRGTLYPTRGKKPMTAAELKEEQNMEYVAITRAKKTLVWVEQSR
jgi:superfamily I DNA/RNA helicase